MRYPPSPSPPLPSRLAIYVAGVPVQTDWGPSSTLQLGCRSLSWLCFSRPVGVRNAWYELHTLSREVLRS
jgi:hypothetical protein